jgi:thiamine biosynthesis lipoprotein
VTEWRGTALGAEGRLLIAGLACDRARAVIASSLAEIERLERVFSLYRPDSELSRLNAAGRLEAPSHDFLVLARRALAYWRTTEGAFNPALQPLWRHLARHFAAHPHREPDRRTIARLLELADPGRIAVEAEAVILAPGMALTFNGIAQGYISDRIADLLAAEGLTEVLVDLGELRALPGRRWRIAVPGVDGLWPLAGRALATSAPAGTRFTADGRWHHLLDPQNGRPARAFASVTVAAASAAEADALSTAFAVSSPEKLHRLAQRFPGIEVAARQADGRRLAISSL